MQVDQALAERVERWKAEIYLDLSEQRNPGTDEFAKGFNYGIIKARDTIYAKLPTLFESTEIEHLQSHLNAATEALRPFAALAGKFSDCVVEICAPHPENPSPRIEPFDTKHFDAALKTVETRPNA